MDPDLKAALQHALARVIIPGAIGGFLGWLFGVMGQAEPKVNPVADAFIGVLLGAGASYIFVYLIANANRDDTARLIGLALLSGFFWEPVWSMSSDLIDREQEKSQTRQAEESFETASLLLEKAKEETDESTKTELLDSVEKNVAVGTAKLARISSPENRAILAPALGKLTTDLKANTEISSQTQMLAQQALGEVVPQPQVITVTPSTYPMRGITGSDLPWHWTSQLPPRFNFYDQWIGNLDESENSEEKDG